MNTELEVMKTVKIRLSYFDQIMRNTKYNILQLVIQDKINGKRCQVRRKTSWLKLNQLQNCSVQQ